MKFKTLLIATTLAAVSTTVMAARPTSIKYTEDIVLEDDIVYSYYVVTCSNGEKKDLSAWDNRKSWCPGKGLKDDCSKKQIKTAKAVCR